MTTALILGPAPGPSAPDSGSPSTSPRARRRRTGASWTALRWVSPLALVVLWQVASSTGLLDPDVLPAPRELAGTTAELYRSGELVDALLVSTRRAALGFAFGALAAVVLGLAVGLSRLGDALIDPLMQMVRMLPLFGLIPLFIVWFGIKEEPKIYLVALGVVVPLYLNLVAALRGVDPDLKEAAISLRLTRWEQARHLVLPSVLPGALVGLRQSLGVAWLALIVAEQINAGAGLGYLINHARDFLRTDVIVVGLLCYAVLGLLTDLVVRALERRALRWRDEGVRA
ncbi:ABC transporter permease [Nocardioides ochotonae]|uniref:ABC transporter permease n=1 Tax=Nocardioides ochotonae TaxID=2685869 RepID=UPI001CD37D73|nr:ABC transporter permease [Nocardioides ochotonae]